MPHAPPNHGNTTETTREGITADLEAFKQAGVGGVVYYDQVHGKAEGADTVFSQAWWKALKFAAAEAKRLGLTFEISLYLRIKGLHSTARVWINSKEAGHLWCSPWEVDVTDLLQKGGNEANQLTNRMIGDANLPEQQRTTFATTPLVKATDPLLPAGITEEVEWVVR